MDTVTVQLKNVIIGSFGGTIIVEENEDRQIVG